MLDHSLCNCTVCATTQSLAPRSTQHSNMRNFVITLLLHTALQHALQSRLHAAEASNASVTERAANLAGSVAELEGQLAAVRHALEEARQELACCKTSMQQVCACLSVCACTCASSTVRQDNCCLDSVCFWLSKCSMFMFLMISRLT